jgi:arylsulfatase A-like enzyme
MITSDHGDEFSEHGGLSHDGKMYSELLHVPLLIYDRSFAPTTIDTPVSLIDIPPTICDLMDVEPASSFKGRSLYPFDSVKPQALYGEAMGKIGHKEKDTDRPIHYMVEDGFKAIFRQDGSIWEAYDIVSDPKDAKDISKKITQVKKDKLDSFIKRNK